MYLVSLEILFSLFSLCNSVCKHELKCPKMKLDFMEMRNERMKVVRRLEYRLRVS